MISKRTAFVLILIIFIMLYSSVTLNLPTLGSVGVVLYGLVALSQIIKVQSTKK